MLKPCPELDVNKISTAECQRHSDDLIKTYYLKYPLLNEVDYDQLRIKLCNIEQFDEGTALCIKCHDENIRGCLRPNYAGLREKMQVINGNLVFCTMFCEKYQQYLKQQEMSRKFTFSRIPRRYEGLGISSYNITDDNEIAVAYIGKIMESRQDGAYIFGDVGTGKTMLACIAANQALREGRSVFFASVPELMSDMKASFDKKNDSSPQDMLKDIIDSDLVILDDIGSEYGTSWACEQLFIIINSRLNNDRQTIITSNYDPDELVTRLSPTIKGTQHCDNIKGNRIVSRILEMCQPLQITGRDYRRSKRM